MSWRRKLDRARIEIGEDTRSKHMAVVESALEEAKRPVRRYGRALAIAFAVVLTVPVVALAAENSEPGDFLYPIRQIFDPAQRDRGHRQEVGGGSVETRDQTLTPPVRTERETDREVPDHPPVTRPPTTETPETRPPVRERPTTTTTTTTVPETTTTKPDRPPPTKPPRDD